MDTDTPAADASWTKASGAEEREMAEAIFFPGAEVPTVSLKRLVEDYERRLILDALERVGGNQRRAAAELGVLPTTLNEKMRRLGLRACDRLPEPPLPLGSPPPRD
jgi:DNA-binding NtrC family response regulator